MPRWASGQISSVAGFLEFRRPIIWGRNMSNLDRASCRLTPSLAWAGILIGGNAARLGPQASGILHNLLSDAPKPIDVLIPTGRSARVGGEWRFIRERSGARSLRSVSAPPRLTVEDTVLDLSAAASDADLIAVVTKAVQARRTTPRRLLEAMNQRSRYRHRQLMADILGDVATGAESPLEMKYLHDVERPHGLPRGNRQQRRHGLPYLSDVGYDEFRVLVELDGRVGHEGVGRFRDMNRDNRFALIEWITLRYGWYDVSYRPCSSRSRLLQPWLHAAGTAAQRGVPDASTCLKWSCWDDRARLRVELNRQTRTILKPAGTSTVPW